MEEQIKHTVARQRMVFIVFWLLPILLIVIGETGINWVGMYATDVRAIYVAEASTILLTAICVPVSLKLFAWVLVRKIDYVTIPQALRFYSLWSIIRMVLLALPVLTGFVVYYLMLSNTGVLCALIALTASLFCIPGEGRLRRELQINKKEEA